MKKALKFLNENHHYVIAAIILLLACFWTYGCESKVKSVLNPGEKVTRAGLQLELDYLVGQLEIKFATLDRQDELKQTLLDKGTDLHNIHLVFESGNSCSSLCFTYTSVNFSTQ